MRLSTSALLPRRLPSGLCRADAVRRRDFANTAARYRAFAEGDFVLLREKKHSTNEGILTKLRPSKNISTKHRGVIQHADIIGKQPRQIVSSTNGTEYRVHEPTLAEYVRLTPRIVTPIYPSDANLIVSLFDIHVDTYSGAAADGPPLEILEAGTGHGALTLHLSRAIHAANPPFPQAPSSLNQDQTPEDAIFQGESAADLEELGIDAWKASRRAIIHTLDVSGKHSRHARQIVKGFRHGMYARNIDFHIGDVSSWIASQKVLRQTEDPFLSHVFLDLPSADTHLANVAPALHVNGILGVFNPSVTQIGDCVETIRKLKLPYLLDQVIELGVGTIRQWDVRAVTPRAPQRKTESDVDAPKASAESDSELSNVIEGQKARDEALVEEVEKQKRSVMVCRPKVGETVVGGGFLGLWRRMEPSNHQPEAKPTE